MKYHHTCPQNGISSKKVKHDDIFLFFFLPKRQEENKLGGGWLQPTNEGNVSREALDGEGNLFILY